MKLLIATLLVAISYAQTEWSLASPETNSCFEQSFTSDCDAYTSVANQASMAPGYCDYTTYNKYCEGTDQVIDTGIGCGDMTTRYYYSEGACGACTAFSGTCIDASSSNSGSGGDSGSNSGSGGASGEEGEDNPPAHVGTKAYSVEGPQGCVLGVGGGNPTSTEKTCVNGELTVSEWRASGSGSTDCTGTPDETVTITDLGTCKLNDDLGPDVKTTIECTDNKIKATTCGDDVGIICSTDDDGDVRGCTQEMCAELCCRRNSDFEAYTHSYWSEWSMKGECFCGTELAVRTREDDRQWLGESGGSVAAENCATWNADNPDGGDGDQSNDDSAAKGLSLSGIIAAALLWTFA